MLLVVVDQAYHEYVTDREYDAVVGFRNRGGNLMFLSANNFFWRTVISHNHMTRVAKWRDVGRPEAALIGVQYIGNDDGSYTLDGDKVTIGPLATTRKACEQAVMDQETAFLAALQTPATVEQNGGVVTLRAADGATQVTLAGK